MANIYQNKGTNYVKISEVGVVMQHSWLLQAREGAFEYN
jgi:hypothetical protein